MSESNSSMEVVDDQENLNVHGKRGRTENNFLDAEPVDKMHSQLTTLRLSFVNPEDSFINIKWIDINDLLSSISIQWELIAFGSDHKSAIISSSSSKVADQFKVIERVSIDENNYDIKFTELRAANKRGIIYNKFLIPLTDAEILDKLVPQGIKEIVRIKKINTDSGQSEYTGSVIIICEKIDVPSYVWFGKAKIYVSHLNPKPMSCEHCGLLGHKKLKCSKINKKICSTCFYDHDELIVCNKVCKNCNGNHFSLDKSCTQLEKEKKILKIRESHNVNYFDAKEIFINSSTLSSNLELISGRNKSKFQELIDKNEKLFETLRLVREEKQRVCDELKEANHVIDVLNIKVVNLEDDNKQLHSQLDSQEVLLTDSLNRNQIEINEVSKRNLEAIEQNKILNQKNIELQNKVIFLEKSQSDQLKALHKKVNLLEKSRNDHSIEFQRFIESSEVVSNAYKDYRESDEN